MTKFVVRLSKTIQRLTKLKPTLFVVSTNKAYIMVKRIHKKSIDNYLNLTHLIQKENKSIKTVKYRLTFDITNISTVYIMIRHL